MALSSSRAPMRTALSRFIAPNSPVGHATVAAVLWKCPAVIAIAPSPYALRSTMVIIGTLMCPPRTNSREKWRTVAVCSASGPTMKPGVSQIDTTSNPNASHSCRNRASLSAPSASICPAEHSGVVGDDAHGSCFDACQCRDDADAEAAAQFGNRVGVEQGGQDGAHIVGALPVLRHDVTQVTLIRRFGLGQSALKVG